MPRGTWVRIPGRSKHFAYGTLTPSGEPFQVSSTMFGFFDSLTRLQPSPDTSRYPQCTTLAGFDMHQVWALPSSLAATGGIAFAFSSSGY